ncbi:MAG: sulfatase-like hydrolase/transferase [Deltaproteobacteria bacterium]|nr:sulfatase-like hydrolase/transferase [Deltaproteobacteria bacterium]
MLLSRKIVALAALLAATLACGDKGGSNRASGSSDGPNIVLILVDDLGWSDVSSNLTNLGNGSSFYETPTIDALANDGLSFTQAYTQQNCQPSRAALVSGQFATGPRNGVYNVGSLDRANVLTVGYPDLPIIPAVQADDIDPAGISIFETIGAAGYDTAWIGKIHGTGEPEDLTANHGVDFHRVVSQLVKGTVNGVSTEIEFFALNDDVSGWMFENPDLSPYALPYDQSYIDDVLQPLANGNDPSVLLGTAKHLTDAVTDAAVDYIASKATTRAPFFLYLPFNAVHVEVNPRADLKTKYEDKWLAEEMAGTLDPNAKSADYAGFVEQLDQNIARIVNALDDPDADGDNTDSIVDDTLVIFYSDNGGQGSFNAPLRGVKGTFFEGSLRVPLIFRWPGVITPRTTSDQSVHLVDFYPTLAEVAEAALPKPGEHTLDGESFVPILIDEATRLSRDSLYWHFPGYLGRRQSPNSLIQKRIGNDDYKLFYFYETGRYEMYNITQDLSETTDLLGGAPTVADQLVAEALNADLRDRLIADNAPTGTWAATGEPVPYPPDTIDFNAQPVAEIVVPQTVYAGTFVALDAGTSSDPNGDRLTFSWTPPPGITLSDTTAMQPTFTAPEVDTDTVFTFTLTVNDGRVDSMPDSVDLTVWDPKRNWSFDADGDTEGWEVGQDATITIADGELILGISGNFPELTNSNTHLGINALEDRYLRIRMLNDTRSDLWHVVFYKNGVPYEVSFQPSMLDTELVEYVIDLSVHDQWSGIIDSIGLNPAQLAGSGSVAIDFIYLVNDPNCVPEGGTCCSMACQAGGVSVPSLGGDALALLSLALVLGGAAAVFVRQHQPSDV